MKLNVELNFTTSKLAAYIMLLVWAASISIALIKGTPSIVVPFTNVMIPTIGGILSVKNWTDKNK